MAQMLLFVYILLVSESYIDGKIIETQVIPQKTFSLLIDTGSELSWILTNKTTYHLVKKEGNNVTEIRDYGKNWTQFFSSSPTNITPPQITGDDQLDQISYGAGSLIVDYAVDQNPIELRYEDWTVNLNMRLAVRVMQQTKHKRHFSGVIGLQYNPDLEIMASLLHQSYYQHNETSKPMMSVDINLKGGEPTSPSYFGFGQPITPIGVDRRNVISIPSHSENWIIKIKYIKLQFRSTEFCFGERYTMLDTGATMIYLPEELKLQLPVEKRNYTIGYKNFRSHRWRRYIPIVHIEIGDAEITVPPEYLYYVKKGNYSRSMLRSMTTKWTRSGRALHSQLGVGFLSAVYTEFYFDPTNLGTLNVRARVVMISKIN